MNIAGLQKTTLLDYPGQIACTVFLAGCNLRCPFCHNPSLVLPGRCASGTITEESLLSFLQTRKGKLDGVCITGGEPTLYPQLPRLMEKIRALGFLIKLDTNGSNPEMLKELLENGMLDYVAMDIKNSPGRYRQTCGGVDVLKSVEESAGLLMAGETPYEFRTTAVHPFHTPGEMEAVGKWLRGAKRYYLQQFVDSGDLVGSGVSGLTKEEMEALRRAALPYIPNTHIRGI